MKKSWRKLIIVKPLLRHYTSKYYRNPNRWDQGDLKELLKEQSITSRNVPCYDDRIILFCQYIFPKLENEIIKPNLAGVTNFFTDIDDFCNCVLGKIANPTCAKYDLFSSVTFAAVTLNDIRKLIQGRIDYLETWIVGAPGGKINDINKKCPESPDENTHKSYQAEINDLTLEINKNDEEKKTLKKLVEKITSYIILVFDSLFISQKDLKTEGSGIIHQLAKEKKEIEIPKEFEVVKDTTKKWPLLADGYEPIRDYETGFIADIIDRNFVIYHLLLNSCALLSDISIGDKKVGDARRNNLTSLTRCIFNYIADPPLINDIYHLSMRLRIINEFMRKLLHDASGATFGKAVGNYIKSIFNLNNGKGLDPKVVLSKALEKFNVEGTEYRWPNNSFDDEEYQKAIKKLLNNLTQSCKAYQRSRLKETFRPVNILISAKPGSGKSLLVKELCNAAEKKIHENGSKIKFGKLVSLNCSQYETWEDLKRNFHGLVKKNKGKTIIPVFFDEIDSLEDSNIYARLLPLMWESKLDDKPAISNKARLLLFFAASRFSTCREYRLHLMTVVAAKKGNDFVSRIDDQIDIPGVDGAGQYAARIMMAAVHLQKHFNGGELENVSVDDVKNLLDGAGLNLALTSGRAVEKWTSQYIIEKCQGKKAR